MSNVIYNQDQEELYQKAAEIIAKSINHLLTKQKEVVFAVCGGRSVPPIFKNLANNETIDWKKVHIFIVDEKLAPITDKESNYLLVKENLIDSLIKQGKISEENIHPFIFKPDNDDLGVMDYVIQLKEHGGVYDICLLSSGEDGHIGGIYPEHDSVKNDSEFFITFHDSPKPPKDRMTMSKKLLEKAQVCVLLFIGEAKKQALEKFNDQFLGVKKLPAKIVKSTKEWHVLTDQRA